MNKHALLYKTITDLLVDAERTRKDTVDEATRRLARSLGARGTSPDLSLIRAQAGAVFNEMLECGVLTANKDRYSLTCARPVAIRVELCEKEILAFLKGGSASKYRIRDRLETVFGTKCTPSQKDDNILYSYIGQVLKRLTRLGIIGFDGNLYFIKKEKAAKIDDIGAMLEVKGDFLTRLHAKGGEFFEHFFMTLLGKYLSKHGRTVLENYTTGGSYDGGIDGVIKTEDSLGFREVIMVQTKNRLETTSETTVRGFYGAVCAKNGSRGIFATTSDFHSAATDFLNGIDNCVGVDGTKLFNMAKECQYGMKKKQGAWRVDTKIL